MIELTEGQRQELNQPEPLAIDPRTKETYVLIRRELFERVKDLLQNSPGTNEQANSLAPDEWIARWRAWVGAHQVEGTVADDDRESIYAGRGK